MYFTFLALSTRGFQAKQKRSTNLNLHFRATYLLCSVISTEIRWAYHGETGNMGIGSTKFGERIAQIFAVSLKHFVLFYCN